MSRIIVDNPRHRLSPASKTAVVSHFRILSKLCSLNIVVTFFQYRYSAMTKAEIANVLQLFPGLVLASNDYGESDNRMYVKIDSLIA